MHPRRRAVWGGGGRLAAACGTNQKYGAHRCGPIDFRHGQSDANAVRYRTDDARQYAASWRASSRRHLPYRCVPSSGSHRRVDLFRRHWGAVVCHQGRVRQVRGAWPPYRRASELEGTTAEREPDREAMALRPPHRDPAWRRQLIFDAVFAIALAIVIVALAKIAFGFL